jgi:catechol 2,3-dioxygenase-like lactoylglutathione lyase family enzyme
MLGDYEVIAFIQTTQPDIAKAFYRDILGLKFEEDTPFALVFWTARTCFAFRKCPS